MQPINISAPKPIAANAGQSSDQSGVAKTQNNPWGGQGNNQPADFRPGQPGIPNWAEHRNTSAGTGQPKSLEKTHQHEAAGPMNDLSKEQILANVEKRLSEASPAGSGSQSESMASAPRTPSTPKDPTKYLEVGQAIRENKSKLNALKTLSMVLACTDNKDTRAQDASKVLSQALRNTSRFTRIMDEGESGWVRAMTLQTLVHQVAQANKEGRTFDINAFALELQTLMESEIGQNFINESANLDFYRKVEQDDPNLLLQYRKLSLMRNQSLIMQSVNKFPLTAQKNGLVNELLSIAIECALPYLPSKEKGLSHEAIRLTQESYLSRSTEILCLAFESILKFNQKTVEQLDSDPTGAQRKEFIDAFNASLESGALLGVLKNKTTQNLQALEAGAVELSQALGEAVDEPCAQTAAGVSNGVSA